MENLEDCKQRSAQLEGLLSKILEAGVLREGKVLAAYDGFYRVRIDEREFVMAYAVPGKKLEVGNDILANDKVIVMALPDQLRIPEPKIDFRPVHWEDVKGLKSQVLRIKDTVENHKKWQIGKKNFNIKLPAGILLYGPPGCGKTKIAKAIATTLLDNDKGKSVEQGAFTFIKGGEALRPLVGQAEGIIREAFERGRRFYKKTGARGVIFIDEAEAILSKRGSGISADSEKTIVPTFLAEMDGEKETPIVILATNHPERLDKAIIRPGRIDIKIPIDRPNVEDSMEIMQHYLKGLPLSEDADKMCHSVLTELQNSTQHWDNRSGALLETLVNNAKMIAVNENACKSLTTHHLLTAIKDL